MNHSKFWSRILAIIIVFVLIIPKEPIEGFDLAPEMDISFEDNVLQSTHQPSKTTPRPTETNKPAPTTPIPKPETKPSTESTPYEELIYSADNSKFLIFLDAGHGWSDNGSSI